MKGLHLVIKNNHQSPTSGFRQTFLPFRRGSKSKKKINENEKKKNRRHTAPAQELNGNLPHSTSTTTTSSSSRPNYHRSKSENNAVGDGWESTSEFLSHVMNSAAPVLNFNPVDDPSEEEEINHNNASAANEEKSNSKITVLKEDAIREAQAIFGKISFAFQSAGHALEQKVDEKVDIIATKLSHFTTTFKNDNNDNPTKQQQKPVSMTMKGRNGGILLHGCVDEWDHKMTVRETVENLRPLKGRIGLKVAGFEYRVVSIDYENPIPSDIEDDDDRIYLEPVHDEECHANSYKLNSSNRMDTTKHDETDGPEIINEELQPSSSSSSSSSSSYDMAKQQDNNSDADRITHDDNDDNHDESTMMTRLFHIETNTMIASQNRRRFIADGDMYDAMARLCQEYAQEVMMKEGNMEWVTVSEAGNNAEPIRALVNEPLKEDDSLLDQKPTLLIATGRGKVRAGIFSRQHIMISGLECSTALPIIRQAKKRQMNVVMLDPNVHGERLGMITFEKSMAKLFSRWESSSSSSFSSSSSSDHYCPTDRPPLAKRDLFVLSHSQSGAQLANYLLDKSEHYVPHIRAVAFTDATHNIQWAKEKDDLHQLLESEKCVYFRCSKQQPKGKKSSSRDEDALEPLDSVGQEVETDIHWQQRFGRINTRCAGTSEHSLTNWFVRFHIWDHFDSFMGTRRESLSSRQWQNDVDQTVYEGDII